MKSESLLLILYPSTISLKIIYPTGYIISFRAVRDIISTITINLKKSIVVVIINSSLKYVILNKITIYEKSIIVDLIA